MKKLFKSLAIAGLATGALLSTAGLASAQQTASLTVVIDKIELMTNGDTIPVTVYQPSAGIAATTTTTIDLFNASQKLGVRLPIAAPQAGTYNTMLVTFSTLAVGSSNTVSRSLVADLQAARLLGTDAQGRGVLVFGSCGTASGGAAGLGFGVCADLRPGAAGVDIASAGVIQPIVSTGLNTSINLPALNLFLPRSEVTISGTQVFTRNVPSFVPVVSEIVDNARRPNVTIGVKPFAFRTVSGVTGSTFPVRVGLVACGSLSATADCSVGVTNKRPNVSRVVNLVSGSTVTAASITEVTFIDVPDGHYFPIAWRDANSNGLWDDGEATAVVSQNTTSAAAILTVVSGTLGTGTYQMDAVSASTISSTRVLAGSTNELGGAGNDGFVGEANTNTHIVMAPRVTSATISIATVGGAETPNNATAGGADELRLTTADASPAIAAGATAGNSAIDASITFFVGVGDANTVSATRGTVTVAEVMHPNGTAQLGAQTGFFKLATGITAQLSDITYAAGDLTFNNIPFNAITALGNAGTSFHTGRAVLGAEAFVLATSPAGSGSTDRLTFSGLNGFTPTGTGVNLSTQTLNIANGNLN
jgi:hypothetical protein